MYVIIISVKLVIFLSKINIKTTIISNGERSEQNYIAIKNKNKYSYQEQDCSVKLIIDDTITLKRENEEYSMTLVFNSKENTKGVYRLKQENVKMDLEIETDYIIILDNMIKIHYFIKTTEQDVTYILEEGE